ncbi:MAG: membrane protein insertase YidC, partial [Halioglobus sp.]|nr:membrane protein insertase YidC [Halioglobus sp.]
MDLQRILLIGAIAVLSFMLLTEWVAFKEARTAAIAEDSSRLLAPEGTPGPASLDTPDLPTSTPPATADDELPEAPVSAAEEAPATPAAVSDRRLVRVETDVLRFVIDLTGGDIIELSLPQHRERLDGEAAFVLLEQNDQLVYIARSGLLGPDGIDADGRAEFEASADQFTLADGEDSLTIDLKWRGNDVVTITKRFTLRRGDYLVDIDYLVDNQSEQRWQGNLFGQIKRQSGPPPSQESSAMGMQPFLGVATTQPDDRFTKFTFEDLADESFKAQLPGGWIAMIQHYFLSA